MTARVIPIGSARRRRGPPHVTPSGLDLPATILAHTREANQDALDAYRALRSLGARGGNEHAIAHGLVAVGRLDEALINVATVASLAAREQKGATR